jgi:hypothetical protein
LTTDILKVITDYDGKHYIKLVKDIIKLVEDAKDDIKECLKGETTVIEGVDIKCLIDAVEKLINDV